MSRCVFNRMRQELDGEDIAALNTLLENRGHLDIARELTAAGFPMSEHTVRRHRKGDCMCKVAA